MDLVVVFAKQEQRCAVGFQRLGEPGQQMARGIML
jgi:hypothetical protein